MIMFLLTFLINLSLLKNLFSSSIVCLNICGCVSNDDKMVCIVVWPDGPQGYSKIDLM